MLIVLYDFSLSSTKHAAVLTQINK